MLGEFEILNDEYEGDFNLDLTINSGQTSQLPWKYQDNAYYENLIVDDKQVLVKLQQENLNDPVNVKYYTENKINEDLIYDRLFYLFDLNYPMDEFKNYLSLDDKLSDVYMFNQGLRLFKAQSPYECIISSIASANNSIKRWTKTTDQIRQNHGESIEFENKKYYIFPDEETFLKIPEDKLKDYGCGYRSSYMINTTKMIQQIPDFHNKIYDMNYNDAYNELIKLEGVGPKVADCILLYGYDKHEAYPVDVWINRITTHLYFNSQKISNKKITSFAQEKFGNYAGYVQLYLFNYARKSGLLSKLKK